MVEPARATATGLVCIADQTLNPTNCPAEPANLTGNVGDTITVAVNIQGVSSLNGFDIVAQVDPAVLQPLNISLADSILGNDCYDYHSGCRLVLVRSTNSTMGVARLAMTVFSLDISGAGNLFEINYKVLSSNTGTAITFMLGCGKTGKVCVTVVGLQSPSTVGIVNVALQTGSFGVVVPSFSITPAYADVLGWGDYPYETVHSGFSVDRRIALGSLGGFNGTINLSVALVAPCYSQTCPSATVNSTTITLSPAGTGWTTLTFVAPPQQFDSPVSYLSVNVTGTSGSLSRSAIVTFAILPPDFSMAINYHCCDISPTLGEYHARGTIGLQSIGGFGTVKLNVDPTCQVGWTCRPSSWSLGSTNLTLASGATASTTFDFSAPPELNVPVVYFGNFTAATGYIFHHTSVVFQTIPANFTVALDWSMVTISRGQSTSAAVRIPGWFWVNGSLSISVDPNLNKGPSATLQWPVICYRACYTDHYHPFILVNTTSTTTPRTYYVTITASNPWFTHTATLSVTVLSQGHSKNN